MLLKPFLIRFHLKSPPALLTEGHKVGLEVIIYVLLSARLGRLDGKYWCLLGACTDLSLAEGSMELFLTIFELQCVT